MIKIFPVILFCIFIISGCSKEKNSSSDIKIEQQNTAPIPKQNEGANQTADSSKKIIVDSLQSPEQTSHRIQQQETVFLKSKQAGKYIGKNATISGYVADVYKNEKVAYLNFDAKFPKNTVSAVIFKDDFTKFGDLNRFKNKNVEINGVISEYNGKPQVILKKTSQVKITN